jgi:hypothetical protein
MKRYHKFYPMKTLLKTALLLVLITCATGFHGGREVRVPERIHVVSGQRINIWIVVWVTIWAPYW